VEFYQSLVTHVDGCVSWARLRRVPTPIIAEHNAVVRSSQTGRNVQFQRSGPGASAARTYDSMESTLSLVAPGAGDAPRAAAWAWLARRSRVSRRTGLRRLGLRTICVRPLLARKVLVHGELVNVRCTPCNPDGGHRGPDAFCCEPVKVLARLPEIDHAPTAVYRTRGVKDEPVRGIAVRVDRLIEFVYLLGCAAGEFEAYTYSHGFSFDFDQATQRRSVASLPITSEFRLPSIATVAPQDDATTRTAVSCQCQPVRVQQSVSEGGRQRPPTGCGHGERPRVWHR